VRRREDVQSVAARSGLQLQARFNMPTNNLLLVWGANTVDIRL